MLKLDTTNDVLKSVYSFLWETVPGQECDGRVILLVLNYGGAY